MGCLDNCEMCNMLSSGEVTLGEEAADMALSHASISTPNAVLPSVLEMCLSSSKKVRNFITGFQIAMSNVCEIQV